MSPERWGRIRSLFSAAVSLAPEQQLAFLEQECPDDPGVRAEVGTLLENERHHRDFMEAEALKNPAASFAPGQLAGGRFRIVRFLGRGGMGQVYEAEDTLLGERVALKAIHPEIASEPANLTRFRNEIQLARRITHTNVCRIFDLEMDEGHGIPLAFLTMELLNGETLAARLNRDGALPADQALMLARQMAAGLAAAHHCEVVHRDFKSSNVMLVPARDGTLRAVITDFGLAREPETRAGTRTLSGSGNLIGTLGYMAPEQLEHGETSFRSDVYSLGLVLFEMVTGELPLTADTPIGAAFRRLRDASPSPRVLRPELSQIWETVIGRCLEKEPGKRYADGAEVAVALGADPIPAGRRPLPRARWVAAAIVTAFLLASIFWILRIVPSQAPAVFKPVPLTSFPGLEFHPSLSPDGELVAFAWDGQKQDNLDIYVKQIGSGALQRVTTDPAVDVSPAWSPDGQRIAFHRVLPEGVSQIIVKSYLGGPERKLAEWPYPHDAGMGGGRRVLCWSPDGKWLVASGRSALGAPTGLFAISMDTGESRRITSPPVGYGGDSDPALSPDGRRLAFARTSVGSLSEIYLMTVSANLAAAGEARRITFDDQVSASPAWTRDGRAIIYSTGRREAYSRLKRVALSRGAAATPAEPLQGIREPAEQPAISRDGHRLAYTMITRDLNIWELRLPDRLGKAATAASLIDSTRAELLPDYSPDGKKIAFTSDRSGAYEIWVCDRDGSNPAQLTSGGAGNRLDPHWSADGKQIAYVSFAGNQGQVNIVNADGGTPRVLVRVSEGYGNPTWSHDGKWLYFTCAGKGGRQVCKIAVQGGPPVQITKGGGVFAQEAADGEHVYYSKVKGLQSGVWKVPVGGGEETQVLPDVSTGRSFAVTPRGIYYVTRRGQPRGVMANNGPGGATLQFLTFATGSISTVFTTEKQLSIGLSVSPDEKSLLYTQIDRTDSDLWLVDNFR
jgi:Tol biopolymer transport system component/serine/threonine protein kinase